MKINGEFAGGALNRKALDGYLQAAGCCDEIEYEFDRDIFRALILVNVRRRGERNWMRGELSYLSLCSAPNPVQVVANMIIKLADLPYPGRKRRAAEQPDTVLYGEGYEEPNATERLSQMILARAAEAAERAGPRRTPAAPNVEPQRTRRRIEL